MLGFGLLIGLAFPFVVVLLGVPRDIAVRPRFFAVTLIAGIVVAQVSHLLARTVGCEAAGLLVVSNGVVEVATVNTASADANCPASRIPLEPAVRTAPPTVLHVSADVVVSGSPVDFIPSPKSRQSDPDRDTMNTTAPPEPSGGDSFQLNPGAPYMTLAAGQSAVSVVSQRFSCVPDVGGGAACENNAVSFAVKVRAGGLPSQLDLRPSKLLTCSDTTRPGRSEGVRDLLQLHEFSHRVQTPEHVLTYSDAVIIKDATENAAS
jgi:hypothetical protein